jgi:hypothetical protein
MLTSSAERALDNNPPEQDEDQLSLDTMMAMLATDEGMVTIDPAFPGLAEDGELPGVDEPLEPTLAEKMHHLALSRQRATMIQVANLSRDLNIYQMRLENSDSQRATNAFWHRIYSYEVIESVAAHTTAILMLMGLWCELASRGVELAPIAFLGCLVVALAIATRAFLVWQQKLRPQFTKLHQQTIQQTTDLHHLEDQIIFCAGVLHLPAELDVLLAAGREVGLVSPPIRILNQPVVKEKKPR